VAAWSVVAPRRPVTVVDDVRGLYISRWGEPSRRAEFQTAGLQVEVLKWDADNSREGVSIYATAGASLWPIRAHDTNHRVEFFVGLLPAEDDVASPLAALALYSHREGVAVDHGHTVPAGQPLWRGTEMRHFLVLRPIADVIPPLELQNGLHVEFLQAIPIYESELAYKSHHGAEALVRNWEETTVPFWDPRRLAAR
jgi:hypothetical protein